MVSRVDQLIDYVVFEQERTRGVLSDHQAWQILKAILVDTLGVDDKEVTRDARLIQDLGAD